MSKVPYQFQLLQVLLVYNSKVANVCIPIREFVKRAGYVRLSYFSCKYSSTTSGCSVAEIGFLHADLSEVVALLKPS